MHHTRNFTRNGKRGNLVLEDDVLWIGSMEAASSMRKWTLPLTVLGLSGVAAFLLTRKGHSAVSGVFQNVVETIHGAPAQIEQWGEDAQHELNEIRSAVEHIAESLGVDDARQTSGH